MPTLFWTGRLTPPMAALMGVNNILAFITGSSSNTRSMKDRVMRGYEGKFSEDVNHYDERGARFQTKAAAYQLEDLDCRGKQVLDVAGGSGIISYLALQKGAAHVICGDISNTMLAMGRAKMNSMGCSPDQIEFRWLDAEALPFEDNTFDLVITGMSLGLIPDQRKMVSEMARVLRPGGVICLGAHGPEHYWEACDAILRAIHLFYVIGYRFEYWPRSESYTRKLLERCGIQNINTSRHIWRNRFKNGAEAYDFFAAISSNFYLEKVPPASRQAESDHIRASFERRGIDVISDDVIYAVGTKPG